MQLSVDLGFADHVWQEKQDDIANTVNSLGDGFKPAMRAGWLYPYPFFLRETSDFSPLFNLHLLVSPFRLLILGRTYGTYLHYARTYNTNVPTLEMFFYSSRVVAPGLTCRPKKSA